jgi:hypothetical protein
MTQDQSPAVVEFGPASGPPGPAPHRPALSRLLTGARLDDRAVPVIAGLGAVAVFVSMFSPWQLTLANVSLASDDGVQMRLSAGLTELGSLGSGYLMGVFAVAACTALVLFGAPPVRQHARLAGLGVSGALFALVIALGVQLSQHSVVVREEVLGRQPDTSYRTGMYLAFAGVAALGVALYLAGRLPAPVHGDAEAGAEAKEPSLWRWPRRPAKPAAGADVPPPPADLTVSPTTPFVRTPDQ